MDIRGLERIYGKSVIDNMPIIEAALAEIKTSVALIQYGDGEKISVSFMNIECGICNDCSYKYFDDKAILLKFMDLNED